MFFFADIYLIEVERQIAIVENVTNLYMRRVYIRKGTKQEEKKKKKRR